MNKNTTPKESFWDIFKDSNEFNEKAIIGFISFAVMIICIAVDLITGYFGRELKINDYIFNAFVIVTLGSFGISGVEKIFSKKDSKNDADMEG